MDALKQLVMHTDKSLRQVYSTKPEYRNTKDNPVPLLHFILGLNQKALAQTVDSPNTGTAQLRVGGNRSVIFHTSGEPSAQMLTMSLAHARGIESRVIMGDGLVETNRIVQTEARARRVPDSAMRFSLEAGVAKEDIQILHDNQLCYNCGAALRGGNTMPHTYWSCPHKIAIIDEVEARLRAHDEEKGGFTQRGRTQAQANARCAAQQYDDTVDDQTFARAAPRRQQWAEPQELYPGQCRGYPPRHNPHQPGSGYPVAAAPLDNSRDRWPRSAPYAAAGRGAPPARGGFTGGRDRGMARIDNRERQPPAGARFAAEALTLPAGTQPTMQPSQPASAPRSGGKADFPPVAGDSGRT